MWGGAPAGPSPVDPPAARGAGFCVRCSTPVAPWHHNAMTSPEERDVRFSLRTTLDERACAEDAQDRMGGDTSLNTAFCTLIVEGYHYRYASAALDAVPLDAHTMAYVRECADELGITTAQALQLLIRRGTPHQPQQGCRTYASKPEPLQQDRLTPAAPAPEPPRYATPKPAAYPPVPPVAGQVPYDIDQEGAPT